MERYSRDRELVITISRVQWNAAKVARKLEEDCDLDVLSEAQIVNQGIQTRKRKYSRVPHELFLGDRL